MREDQLSPSLWASHAMTTLTTEASLLAAILREPADDTVRLVYADYLEENGQAERAEFIRVQVALAANPRVSETCPHCGCDDGYNHNTGCLYSREDELLWLHGAKWSYWRCAEAPPVLPGSCLSCDGDGNVFGGLNPQFRRGFVYRVTVPTMERVVVNAGVPTGYDPHRYLPTPLLSAICRTTVEEVWVGDREPMKMYLGEFTWWRRGQSLSDRAKGSVIEEPIFDRMWQAHPKSQHEDGFGRWLKFDTADAAKSVLGQAVVAFGKGVRA